MDEGFRTGGLELFSALIKKNDLIAEHSKRVSVLSVIIGKNLGLQLSELESLKLGGLLHDIGKLGISQMILRKPGRLNSDEFEQVKTHPILGGNFAEAVGYPKQIVDIVRYHHERLDGSGYPLSLVGDQIDLPSRIIAVADVYEAMTTTRPYRKALLAIQAFKELSNSSKYDQCAVDALNYALGSEELGRSMDEFQISGVV